MPATDNAQGAAAANRWAGVKRVYSNEDVDRLRGSVHIEHTLARLGAERFWQLLHENEYIPALGCLTGAQAVQAVQGGLKAIYLSGWQVAADANTALETYPDQSLYPVDSVPKVIRRINNAFQRMDQMQHAEGKDGNVHWFAPIVADAEAGFGGVLNAYEVWPPSGWAPFLRPVRLPTVHWLDHRSDFALAFEFKNFCRCRALAHKISDRPGPPRPHPHTMMVTQAQVWYHVLAPLSSVLSLPMVRFKSLAPIFHCQHQYLTTC